MHDGNTRRRNKAIEKLGEGMTVDFPKLMENTKSQIQES